MEEITLNKDYYYFYYQVSADNVEEIEAQHNIVDQIIDQPNIDISPDQKPIDQEIFSTCTEIMSIGSNLNKGGEEILQNFSETTPLHYWKNYPGFYYTTAPYSDMENPLAYMIYWVKNDYFCQASVPADKLNDFLNNNELYLTSLPVN